MNGKVMWVSKAIVMAGSSLCFNTLLLQDAIANEAQFHIVNAGINLGQAAARESVFGEILRDGIPATQVEAIAINMANATAEMIAAENLFQEPFATVRSRNGILVGLTSRIAVQPTIPRPANPKHMERMINGIFHSYGEGLGETYSGSKPDSFQKKPTCDSLFLTVGYYCGFATIVSTVTAPNRRTGFRADARQSDANNQIRSAANLGLRIALDGVAHSEPHKIACSFGEPGLWDALALQKLQPNSPPPVYEGLCPAVARIAKSAGVGSYDPKYARSPSTHSSRKKASTIPSNCSTSEGSMTFSGSTSGILARYGTDRGRVLGTLRGSIIDGYWVETDSNEKCSTAKDGSYYWGRIVATLEARGPRFNGKWNYCDGTPNKDWTGTCSGSASDEGFEPDHGDSSGNGVTFDDPMVDGVPMDNCLKWGGPCGQATADAYCKTRGYFRAVDYTVVGNKPPTMPLNDRRICEQSFCGPMTQVVCTR